MKKISVFLATAIIAAMIFAFSASTKTIVGHWTINAGSSNVSSVEFMSDGKFLAKIPSQHFIVGGKYKFKKEVLSISDTSCNANYWGKYKVSFHGNDTVYTDVISDTCSGRRGTAGHGVFVRDK